MLPYKQNIKIFTKTCRDRRPRRSVFNKFSAHNAFSFDTKGPKEKALQKENPKGKFRSLRRATKALPLETASFLKKA